MSCRSKTESSLNTMLGKSHVNNQFKFANETSMSLLPTNSNEYRLMPALR